MEYVCMVISSQHYDLETNHAGQVCVGTMHSVLATDHIATSYDLIINQGRIQGQFAWPYIVRGSWDHSSTPRKSELSRNGRIKLGPHT
jgi:hypothetical protein